MRVVADDDRLYLDVEGCGLVVQGDAMVRRPTLVLLHGGPGADHSFFKPEFSAMADVAQVVYLDQRGLGRSDRGDQVQLDVATLGRRRRGFCGALEVESPLLVGTSTDNHGQWTVSRSTSSATVAR